MSKFTRREFVGGLSATVGASQIAAQQNPGNLTLWYRTPAEKWTDALPIGNGRLGAMIFGGVAEERLQLNDDTLWSGSPREWNNPGARQHLPEVRRLVLEQQDFVGADRVCRRMQGPYNESYLVLGNLRIRTEHKQPIENYRRELDLESATARVSYRVDGARYVREAFASAPDQVMVVRWSTTNPAGMKLTLAMDSPLQSRAEATAAGTLRLIGKAPAHADPNYVRSVTPVVYDPAEGKGMRFETWLQAIPRGGEMQVEGATLTIDRARSVTMLLVTATGYRSYGRSPDRSGDEIAEECRRRVATARKKSYAALYKDHIADYQAAFHRVKLSLPRLTSASLPTGERLSAFASNPDPDLGAVLSIRALPVDRQFPSRLAARQFAGHLERGNPPAVEFQLDVQYQRPDELLARRDLQFGRVPPAAVRPDRGAEPDGGADRCHQLRLPRLGLPPQRRPLAPVGSRGRLRPGFTDVGQLVHERTVVLRAPLGALCVRRRPRVPAHIRLSRDEIGCRILPGLAGRKPGRAPHHLPFGFDRE